MPNTLPAQQVRQTSDHLYIGKSNEGSEKQEVQQPNNRCSEYQETKDVEMDSK